MKIQSAIVFILSCFLIISCNRNRPLFQSVSPDHSNIHFNNHIIENDTINPFDLPNMYNGGGVGIGDFNNDGLPDIYFTGNQVPCKLYLKKGDFKFEDVTDIAQVNGNGQWCRGVSVVDINNDGLLDIYVCATILPEAEKRQNLLYVNQGVNKEGIPVFKEMAKEYGLNDDSYSTMASSKYKHRFEHHSKPTKPNSHAKKCDECVEKRQEDASHRKFCNKRSYHCFIIYMSL